MILERLRKLKMIFIMRLEHFVKSIKRKLEDMKITLLGESGTSKGVGVLKDIRNNVSNLNDEKITFIWNEILKISINVHQLKGATMAKKCFIEMVELNPKIKDVDGVLKLCDSIKAEFESHSLARLNKGKLKRAGWSNTKMDMSAKNYEKEKKESFNSSVKELMNKTNKR